MTDTNKPATRDLFAQWVEEQFGENEQPDKPTEDAPELENRPSPMGSAENYSPTPTRDKFAERLNEAMANGFSDDSGLWRRII